MECQQACEILSAAHDGELIDAEALTVARAHAESCPECRAFVELMERLDVLPSPAAPAGLMARLEDFPAKEAASVRDAEAREALEHAQPVPVPHVHPAPSRWTSKFTAYATAAAVLLVALGVGGVSYFNARNAKNTAMSGISPSTSNNYAGPGSTADRAGTAPESQYDTAKAGEPTATAPSYVSLKGAVWVLSEPSVSAPATLAAAGEIVTDLGSSDGSGKHAAFWAGSDRSALYVRDAGNMYARFTRAIRTLGGAPYGLVTGTPITAYGQWPTLPGRFAQPTGLDGSPTFSRFGFDDAGADIYVPPSARVEDGFAVAPGRPTTDPGAGNPNWTWWEPIR